MRLFRQQNSTGARDRDDELHADPVSARPEPVPGRRPPVLRYARAGAIRGDAREAIDRAAGRRGQPLSTAIRAKLERALAVDLSGVRVHTDGEAARAAEAIAANAFTIGQDIYFAQDRFAPDSADGFRLLAHEVAHTVQQGGAASSLDGLAVSEPGDMLELEAERVADAVAAEPDPAEVEAVADAIRPRGTPATEQARLDAAHAAVRAIGAAPAAIARDTAAAAGRIGTPPKITYATDVPAPSGGTDRFTVGPGELVKFTGSESGTWSASDGSPTTGAESTEFSWKAPTTPGIFTITLSADGRKATQGISVLAPTSIKFTNVGGGRSFGAEEAGASMKLDMKLGPNNVSFGQIQIKEQESAAVSATGVFATEDSAHHPNPDWTNVRNNNVTGSFDEAWAGPYEQPVKMGKVVWNIPYLWQPRDGSAGGGSFAIVFQSSEVVDSKGTITIIKGSESNSRTPTPKTAPP